MTQVQPKKASLHTALSKKTALNQQHKHCSWHNLKVKMISLLFLFLFCVPLRPRSVLFIPSSCFILLFLTVLCPTSLLTMCHALSSCCIIVAPDTINNHVKTCHEEQKNLHFFAPEYGGRHPPNDTLCYLRPVMITPLATCHTYIIIHICLTNLCVYMISIIFADLNIAHCVYMVIFVNLRMSPMI